jgi:hypothetical protein
VQGSGNVGISRLLRDFHISTALRRSEFVYAAIAYHEMPSNDVSLIVVSHWQ